MMAAPPETPKTKRRGSLLAGAKAYFGSERSKKGTDSHNASPSSLLSKAPSESTLQSTPGTPKLSAEGKKIRKVKRISMDDEAARKIDKHSRRSQGSTADASSSFEGPPPSPQTPRSKQKIRRATAEGRRPSIGAPGVAGSVDDTEMAVSPTTTKTKKTKRRKSLGAMSDRLQAEEDEEDRGRSSRSSSKVKKKERNRSAGPEIRESKRHDGLLSPQYRPSSKSSRQGNVNDLLDHLDQSAASLDDGSQRGKSRATVDDAGRIRRVKKKSSKEDDDDHSDNDGDDGKSRQSGSSKRSKGSGKSLGSKKSSSSKKARDKVDSKRKLLASPRPQAIEENHDQRSEYSEQSGRVRRADVSQRSERRAGRRTVSADDVSNNLGRSLPALGSWEEGGYNQPAPPGTVLSKSFRSHASEITTDTASQSIEFAGLPTPPNSSIVEGNANLYKQIEKLEKKIVELNEEHLKAQFAAQSEAAKLRKEVREEKLELQRIQTERRELRSELRERDMIIDESDRKIQALEKAVESQLDKVDDLEEELRRANDELFYMEEKLSQMENLLANSSAAETAALGKEQALDDRRQERMERRLVERERALEARENKLREERDAIVKQGLPQRKIEQLEQDNRMLLKALNLEKAEAAEKLKQKDDDVKKLQNILKMSQTRNGSSDDDSAISKLMKENMELKQRLAAAEEKANATARSSKGDGVNGASTVNGNGGAHGDGELARQLEATKAEADVMKSKFEAAQRRNQLLEEDIDHWKSVNCNLEDELVDWKSQAANWRAKYEDVVDPGQLEGDDDPEPNILPYSMQRDTARTGRGTRGDDDHVSVTSEPGNSIANLWSKLTTPSAKKATLDGMNSESVREVLARSTFH